MGVISKAVTDLTIKDLEQLLISLEEPLYRVNQILSGVYQRLAVSYDDMTDLPLSLRRKLEKRIILHTLAPVREVKSSDGTIKVLFRLQDEKTIETALMLYAAGVGRLRTTVCLSTQVGCPIGCPFCATGQQGFERNLTAGEIIDQTLYFARQVREGGEESRHNHITNIVFMGMGEPLANYEALMQAIEILTSPRCFATSPRNITISTAGLVPQIRQLSREKVRVGLAVSLHAPENALRNRLVPLNKRYPLEELIPACREYAGKTGRRVSFEYILFSGINDSLAQAATLAGLLKGINCHVNLIPANHTADIAFQPPSRNKVLAFENKLKMDGINCTLRLSRGQDINAGCGQLRSSFITSL
jgi:23S rRNA (adenine2503-C2)-methyltransferase